MKQIKLLSKFFMAGAISTLCDWTVYAALVKLTTASYPVALTLAFICGGVVNFYINRRYTFKIMDRSEMRMMIFMGLATVSWLISMGLLYVAVDKFGIDKILARMGITIVMFFVNFVMQKSVTFKASSV